MGATQFNLIDGFSLEFLKYYREHVIDCHKPIVVTMTRVRNRSSISMENEREPNVPTVKQILHVPIFMLKLSGVYIENFSLSRSTVQKVLFDCLVMIMGLLIVARFIAGFVSDNNFSGRLTGRLTFAVSHTSNVVMFPVFVFNTSRNLPRVLARFSTFQSKYGLAIDVWKSKRRTIEACVFFVICAVLYLVTTFSVNSLRIFPESALFISRLLPFGYRDGYIFDLVSLTDTLTITIYMFIVGLEIVIACLLSYIIIKEFRLVTRKADILVRQTNVSASEIGKLRCWHFEVTQLVMTANCLIQPIVLLVYMIMLPSICFTVYGIVHSTLEMIDITMLAELLVAYILGITVLTGIGAIISSQAHSVLQSLFELSLQNMSTDAQYQVFISQVTGQNIGISIYGMFTMDGSTFLMIFGTVISYTVVVLQTQTGSCGITRVLSCNCT